MYAHHNILIPYSEATTSQNILGGEKTFFKQKSNIWLDSIHLCPCLHAHGNLSMWILCRFSNRDFD